MGWDLYTFAIPIYGSSVGLSASTIGIVMGFVRGGDLHGAHADAGVRAAGAREWTVVALAARDPREPRIRCFRSSTESDAHGAVVPAPAWGSVARSR
jgi:hypothetical protein